MEEQQLYLSMSRRKVNLLTSLMPTMEGLFLATVTDGKNGLATLRFSPSVKGDVQAFVEDFCRDGECRLLTNPDQECATTD